MAKILGLAALAVIIIGGIFYMWGDSDATKESLVIKGSDTEVQLVSNLAEAFLQKSPEHDVSVTGGGSGTGIAALLNKEIEIANSSRQLNDEERATAVSRGLNVQEFILARDGLSVIAHVSNPVRMLTVEQVGKIYRGEVTNWKDVGGPDRPIVLYGRQSTSGTYVFFRDTVLKGDYAQTMRNMEGSQAIVDAVINDEGGIGYVGVGYVKSESGAPRSDIVIMGVAKDSTATAVSPLDKERVLSGEYPIFRAIYQYLSAVPAKDSVAEKFLRFEASPEGQAILESAGFYPVTAGDAKQNQALFDSIR